MTITSIGKEHDEMDKALLKQKPFYLSDEDIAWVESTRDSMSVDEKVGQLFCACVRAGTIEELEGLNAITPFGGVMYRPLPAETCVELTNYLNTLKTPVLIAADLEHGGNIIEPNGTLFGAQLAAAATRDTGMAEKLATICAEEGKAVGINWAFAPDSDLDLNFRNPITNCRTYGSDPDLVAEMIAAYVKKMQSFGMAASCKHFPGDGVDERDHHLLTNVNTLSVEEWDNTYGKVYRAAIDAGTMSIMVAHIVQPAYIRHYNKDIEDKDMMPASLSKELMVNLLREKLGFNGLIVTDATTMSGFTIPMPRRLSVPTAIANGADVFLFSRNMAEDVSFMKAGVESGLITEERLNDAVTRILAMKAALGLNKPQKTYTLEETEKMIGTEEHHAWAKECADRSVTLVKEEKGVLPLTPDRYKRIMYFPLKAPYNPPAPGKEDACDTFEKMLKDEGFEVTTFSDSKALEGRLAPTTDFVGKYDAMVYVANYPIKSGETTVRIVWTNPLGSNCPHFLTQIPTIFISLGNPYHLQDVPRIRTFINAYANNQEVLDSVMDKITGRSEFTGISPVDPFCGKWDTRL